MILKIKNDRNILPLLNDNKRVKLRCNIIVTYQLKKKVEGKPWYSNVIIYWLRVNPSLESESLFNMMRTV